MVYTSKGYFLLISFRDPGSALRVFFILAHAILAADGKDTVMAPKASALITSSFIWLAKANHMTKLNNNTLCYPLPWGGTEKSHGNMWLFIILLQRGEMNKWENNIIITRGRSTWMLIIPQKVIRVLWSVALEVQRGEQSSPVGEIRGSGFGLGLDKYRRRQGIRTEEQCEKAIEEGK